MMGSGPCVQKWIVQMDAKQWFFVACMVNFNFGN
jgi:hypothetical protein